MYLYRALCVSLFLAIGLSPICGQFNVKIGYNPIFGAFNGVNAVQESYVPGVGEIQNGFADLSFMHGIQLGLRYKVGKFATEIGWESLSSNREALSLNRTTEAFAVRAYDHDIRTWSLVLDQYLNPVGFGAAINRTNYSIGREVGNNSIPIIDESQWGLRLQLNLVIQESSQVSFLIRPYYQFYLDDYNIEPLAADLNNTAASAESLSYFGLSLVFYNGRRY